jgi:Right handed beta helix region
MCKSRWHWCIGLILALLLCGQASAQATRTWVSGVGDDANNCTRTAPCKTFAGAISKTASGGIIDVLDPGGFGALTIIKSITIENVGKVAGVLVSGTNAFNINGDGVVVTLRNIQFEGNGTGLVGVSFIKGSQLIIEDSDIFNFQGGSALGINFAPSTSAATLVVRNTTIHNCGAAANVDGSGGIQIKPSGTGSANVVLENVHVVDNNGFGVAINGPASVTVRNSVLGSNLGNGAWAIGGTNAVNLTLAHVTIDGNDENGIYAQNASAAVQVFNSSITGNARGLSSATGGTIVSFGNNAIGGNVIDGAADSTTALK